MKIKSMLIMVLMTSNFIIADETKKVEDQSKQYQDKVISINIYDKSYSKLFVSISKNIAINNQIKKEFVYFGEYSDYRKDFDFSNTIIGNVAAGTWDGFTSGAKMFSGGGVVGAAFGLVFTGIGAVDGLSKGIYNEINKPFEYILAYDIINTNNEKARIVVFFLTHEKDENKVKEIMESKIKERIEV